MTRSQGSLGSPVIATGSGLTDRGTTGKPVGRALGSPVIATGSVKTDRGTTGKPVGRTPRTFLGDGPEGHALP